MLPALDAARILVYGPHDVTAGALVVLDAATREIQLEYELESPILAVLDRPGTDEFLVTTTDAVIRLGLHRRRTVRGRFRASAWSSSGRHLCTVTDKAARVWALDEDARPPGYSLGTCFSPRGTYLLDGSSLCSGIDGQRIADPQVWGGRYLEGGPPAPPLHLGEALLLCFGGGLRYWVLDELASWTPEADPVAPRRVNDLRGAHWHCVAYDVAGTCIAMAHERTRSIELIELPSGRPITTIETELDVQLIALSSTAELVAAVGEGRVEVRRRSGELVFRGEDPFARVHHNGYFRRCASTLGFSTDDRLLGLHDTDSGTVTWNLVDGSARPRPAAPADFDPLAQHLPGWSIHDGKVSTFIEDASGARLAVSLSGPWLRNPTREHVVACPFGPFELRGSTLRRSGG